MLNINTYHLQCFVMVARLLNYTKAANVLHISQPALSRIIQSLENDLGYELFIRSTRKVALTDAGVRFYRGISRSLDDMEMAAEEARRISEGDEGFLKIGFLPYAYNSLLPGILKEYRECHPEVRLQIRDGEERDIQQMLQNGEIDIALVSDWGTDLSDAYEQIEVYEDQYYAVVSADHPLADAESVTMDMLADEKFVVLNQNQGDGPAQILGGDRIIHLCADYGFLPNLVMDMQARTLAGLISLVAFGEGVAILAGNLEDYINSHGRVVYLPIRDIEIHFHGLLCYRKDSTNTCIRAFADISEKYMREWNGH